EVRSGALIKQSVRLSLEGTAPKAVPGKDQALVFKFSRVQTVPLPKIGIGKSGEVSDLSVEDVLKITPLRFNHYRVVVRLFEEGWEKNFRKDSEEARLLKVAMEIILHFP